MTETSTSQAVQLGTNLRFLNRIFQNPNSKCLLGCAQTPFVLHRADVGCAFVSNAFITKRRDRPEFFSKEGLWSVVVYRNFAFSVLLFSSVRPNHIAGQGSGIKVAKKDVGKGTIFFSADSMLNPNLFIQPIIKVSATGEQGYQPLCKTAALRLRQKIKDWIVAKGSVC